jgi:UDP:flavonoid glycosyltransferase YjiC (YdhE family)
MRVLFSCTATEGHVAPLVPLARAFADLGHDVAFATAAAFEGRLQADGLATLAAGLDRAELEGRMQEYRPRLFALPPAERRPFAYTWRFATIDSPAKLPELLRAVEAWRPGLLVHDAAELCAPPVAAALGIPSVNQGFGQVIPAACHDHAAEAVHPLWDAVGLAPEPWNGMYRCAYVDICPPSLAGEAVPPGTPTFLRRPATPTLPTPQRPWQPARPGLPNVYVTLGTALSKADVLPVLLGALADVNCNVLMTVSRDVDPASLAPWPANATVERFVPQADVLPHCSVVVSHGGSGTTYGALAHGLPLLMMPHQADQFDNAAATRAEGAAEVLMPHEVEPAAIRSAVEALLADEGYATRAQELAAEIAEMPDAAAVAAALAGQSATFRTNASSV